MKLLALDPSSTRTGYAVLRGDRTIIEAGVIRPKRVVKALADRVRSVLVEVSTLLNEHRPTACVVELPGTVMYRRQLMAVAGSTNRVAGVSKRLVMYAAAAGAVYGAMVAVSNLLPWTMIVAGVEATTWTRGKAKADRAMWLKLEYPKYDPATDPGGDVADAIELGLWWLTEQRAARGP